MLAGYINLYLLLSLYSIAIGITQQKLYLPTKHVQSNFKASYSNEMWWDLKIKSFVTWLVYYMSDVTPWSSANFCVGSLAIACTGMRVHLSDKHTQA